jgi:hypothetical protein
LSVSKLDSVVVFNKFFANEQGRDKFNKVLQYASRLLAIELAQRDPKSDWAKRMGTLFAFTRDSRKLFALFKWVVEYDKLRKLMKGPQNTQTSLQIVSALGMLAYWYFDNMIFLVKANVIQNSPKYAKLSMLGWLVALSVAVIFDTQTLADNFSKESRLRSQYGVSSDKNAENPEIEKLHRDRLNLYLNFIKNGSDILIAANGGEVLQTVLGRSSSDRTIAAAGTISGFIALYQVFKTIQ